MSKTLITNTIAIFFIIVSFFVTEQYHTSVLFIGLFALSGAITNQLAIYMLFERVPFLYGSGVIEKNFDTFKKSIHTMIMQEFFNKEKVSQFFQKEADILELAPLVEKADFSPAFDALSNTVMESKFGAAIQMFGGEEALDGLREPFIQKLKAAVSAIVSSSAFKAQLNHYIQSNNVMHSIEVLITERLDELSPKMVKEIVQALIHKHLGWLIVWGGVFGGVIGFISSFFL